MVSGSYELFLFINILTYLSVYFKLYGQYFTKN